MIGVEASVDVAQLLRSAMDALGRFDDAALEELLMQAESASAKMHKVQGGAQAVGLQQAFGELLSSTSRSLQTLERLRFGREDAWAR